MLGRQSGLGRGLGALIPQRTVPIEPSTPVGSVDAASTVPHSAIREIPLDRIDPNPHQPRIHFNHEHLEELVNSIKEHGVLQPIVVTETPDGRYELIMGERRLRASKIAGRDSIPAVIRSATEQQKMELALIENVQRADLDPIEEARAYLRLSDEFGMTQDQVGERVGKSRPHVANIIRLLQLPEEIQRAIADRRISASNARTLLSLPTEQERMEMFQAMLQGNFTVRQTEERVARQRREPKPSDPNLTELEDRLRKAIGTRVAIHRGIRGEGEIKIKFYDDSDLNELVKKLT